MDSHRVKLWKDLFNNKSDIKKSNINSDDSTNTNKTEYIIDESTLIENIIKSSNNGFVFRENIPQSVIKKSIKSAYNNKPVKK